MNLDLALLRRSLPAFCRSRGHYFALLWLTFSSITLLTACSEPPSFEKAKNLYVLTTLKDTDIDFDIPIVYMHSAYVRNNRRWFYPPQERKAVDDVDIDALLPNLEPFTETNATEFDKPGWGRKVSASITHFPRANWNYYFENFAYRLERLPDSSEMPGMLHYRDGVAQHEVFLSHDHAVKELIFISCPYRIPPRPSPSCKVRTLYRNNLYFEYVFGRPFLSQWQQIDGKLRALFDHLSNSNNQYINETS